GNATDDVRHAAYGQPHEFWQQPTAHRVLQSTSVEPVRGLQLPHKQIRWPRRCHPGHPPGCCAGVLLWFLAPSESALCGCHVLTIRQMPSHSARFNGFGDNWLLPSTLWTVCWTASCGL